MELFFKKYQGTGNDFVIISALDKKIELTKKQIQSICERRFGVGADGLILLQPKIGYDFEVVYYNADGSQSFCGNGTRCAVHFAHSMDLFTNKTRFLAIDGEHEAEIIGEEIALKMNDVFNWKNIHSDFELNTGSPHYVRFVEDLSHYDILKIGQEIRYSQDYCKDGINVNLVSEIDGALKMLTYERGVEAETFSCGTGATAVVIASFLKKNHLGNFEKEVTVKGGVLKISGVIDKEKISTIFLKGPAKFVFDGSIKV